MTKWDDLIDRLARIETKIDNNPCKEHDEKISKAMSCAFEAKNLAKTNYLKIKIWVLVGVIVIFINFLTVFAPIIYNYLTIQKSYSQETDLTKTSKVVR